MLESKLPNLETNKETRPNMDKNELFSNPLTLETLVALDVGFTCLLDNITRTDPTLAAALSIDLQQTADRIPMHLPENAHGAAHILQRWAAILNNHPSEPGGH